MRKLKNKHIFVSFEQGASGHKLARVLATLPCIYWYSCEENGKEPWNVGVVNKYSGQRQQSRYHFDRITPKGKLPPTHDYVQKYIPNEKAYYKLFDELFTANGGDDIINNGQRVIYCTHSSPEKLLESFPGSLIFNVVHDPVKTTKRYMDVVTKFPGYVKHYGVVSEDNDYLKFLEILHSKKPGFTIADIWAYETKKKFYEDKFEPLLEKRISSRMQASYLLRSSVDHPQVFNIYGSPDYTKIKEWLDERLR